jgi:hypothetical protein
MTAGPFRLHEDPGALIAITTEQAAPPRGEGDAVLGQRQDRGQ